METTVTQRRLETPDTVTLRLTSVLPIIAGQFVMLGAVLGEREVKRSYSVAAVGADWLEITVRAQPLGLFSKYLFELHVGDGLLLYGPFGRHFIWKPAEHDGSPIVFIAGGTGIAPFRCMIEAATATGVSVPGFVLFSVRSGDDIIYRNELSAWDAAGFKTTVTLTRPTETDLSNWTGSLGRINGRLLTATLGAALVNAHYYVCGPTPLVVDVQTVLASLGVPLERIKTEKYGVIEG